MFKQKPNDNIQHPILRRWNDIQNQWPLPTELPRSRSRPNYLYHTSSDKINQNISKKWHAKHQGLILL